MFACLVSGDVVPSARTHEGFYLGARFGVGELWASAGDSKLSARTFPLELSAGVALARRLVLYGEYYDARTDDVSASNVITQAGMQGFGGGARYYLMPLNLFASASLLASQLSFANVTPADGRYGTHLTTKWGATGRLAVGKEWWLGPDLGLGIAGEVLLGRMAQRGAESSGAYTAKAISLLVSTSYN